METLIAFTACLFLIALGDIISIISKAKIPVMAAIIFLYLLATSLGMPKNYPEISGLAAFGELLFPFFVAAVTTNILPRDLMFQWKFIVIGCIASSFSLLLTVLAGSLFLDASTVFSGAIVTCGGAFTGGMLVIDRLKEIGRSELIALPLLLTMLLDAIGQPIGSFVTKRYILRLKKNWDFSAPSSCTENPPKKYNRYHQPFDSPENPSPYCSAWIPPRYETSAVALFQLAVVVFLSHLLGEATGLGWAFILVILGVTGSFLGFFRLDMMRRTESAGLIMVAIFSMVFQMLGDLSLQLVMDQLFPVVLITLISLPGLLIGGAIGAKLLGCDPMLGMVSSIGLFYFFPGVQNIVTEVTRSNIENSEQYESIFRRVSTPSIIAAFAGSRFCLLISAVLIPLVFHS